MNNKIKVLIIDDGLEYDRHIGEPRKPFYEDALGSGFIIEYVDKPEHNFDYDSAEFYDCFIIDYKLGNNFTAADVIRNIHKGEIRNAPIIIVSSELKLFIDAKLKITIHGRLNSVEGDSDSIELLNRDGDDHVLEIPQDHDSIDLTGIKTGDVKFKKFVSNAEFNNNFTRLLDSDIPPYRFFSFKRIMEFAIWARKEDEPNKPLSNTFAMSVRKAVKIAKEEFDILVIAALDSEMEPFQELIEHGGGSIDENYTEVDGLHTDKGVINYPDGSELTCLLVTCQEMGQVGTMQALSLAKQQYNFRDLYMIGVCGGIPSKVGLLDTVFPKKTYPYQNLKRVKNKKEYRITPGERKNIPPTTVKFQKIMDSITPYSEGFNMESSGYKLLKKYEEDSVDLNNVNADYIEVLKNKKIRDGSMLCGTELVNSEGYLEDFLSKGIIPDDKICSLDMESHAIYYFTKYNSDIRKCLVIKTVMDFAGDKPSTEHEIALVGDDGKSDKVKEIASILSASFLYELLIQRKL